MAATATETEGKVEEKPTASPGAKASAGRSRNNNSKKGATTAPKARTMSAEHKGALALGRNEGRVVNEYLDALESHKPKRGRKVTPEDLKARIERLDKERIPAATKGAERIKLIQERIDLETRLRAAEDTTVITDLEEAFKKVAKSYAERRHISYDAFREAGVPTNVLKEAGIKRAS